MVYKIVYKVLVNRLKIILPSIIDDSQSAFVPNRMIFDNIIVAHEMVHVMKTRRAGRTGFLAAKLDMSKAYDRIEWNFMEGVMRTLGFSTKWISMIMNCVKIVTQWLLMASNVVKLSRQEALDKGILCHLIYFYYVQRVSQALLRKQLMKVLFKGWQRQEEVQGFHIYFLPMIVYFFVGLRGEIVTRLWKFLRLMRKLQGN